MPGNLSEESSAAVRRVFPARPVVKGEKMALPKGSSLPKLDSSCCIPLFGRASFSLSAIDQAKEDKHH